MHKPIHVLFQLQYEFKFPCELNYFSNPVTPILPSKHSVISKVHGESNVK